MHLTRKSLLTGIMCLCWSFSFLAEIGLGKRESQMVNFTYRF